MGKYIVTHGQNIFDVALHIYGSVEGIIDLLMNNPSLSLADRLNAGNELIYTDDFIINSNTVSYFKSNGITPANGERNIYYKKSEKTKVIEFCITNKETSVDISISGNGEINIDWGDNTNIQVINLVDQLNIYPHIFDNNIGTKRKITIYGDNFEIKQINISNIKASEVYFHRPIYIERFIMQSNTTDIGFMSLMPNVFDLNLSYITTNNLLPLIECRQLMSLNLTGANIQQGIIDNYLIHLVFNYNERRSCTVTLTSEPSGIYKEPQRDSNHNYIISSGMEAIWVLTHESSWNEAGQWTFIINDKIYTYLSTDNDNIKLTPDTLDWMNTDVGKEKLVKIESNKDWKIVSIEELL